MQINFYLEYELIWHCFLSVVYPAFDGMGVDRIKCKVKQSYE